jgi:integrase
MSDWFVKREAESEEWAARDLKVVQPDVASEIAQGLREDAQVFCGSPSYDPSETQTAIVRELDDFLATEGKRWGIERGSEDYNRLVPLFRDYKAEAMARTIERIENHLEGERLMNGGRPSVRPSRERAFPDLTATTLLRDMPRPTMLLGKFLDDFMAYQKKAHSEAAYASYALPVRALREIIGENASISSVSRPQIEKVCGVLRMLPKNATKKYPELSLEAAIAAAEREGNVEKRSERTLKNEYDQLVAVFNYAVDDGLIGTNPAKGRKLRADFKVKRKKQRVPFSEEELRKIFAAPLYTGCKDDERNYFKPGSERPRRGRFWIPLLALFHGCRMNELCQLYTEDIKSEDGVSYLAIRTELDDDEIENTGKRQKTEASRRNIPIHPELHRIGFMDYVVERRADTASPMLFPTLKRYAKTGRYSKHFSKWFSSFLIHALGHKPKAVFHSFRHNFRAECIRAKLSTEIAEMLGGWSDGNASSEVEYRHANMRLRFEEISKIAYRNLDLSHLHTGR